MVVQTSYPDSFVEGFAGLKAEPFSLNQVDTGIASEQIALGACVVHGSGDDVYDVAAIDETPVGVAIYDLSHEKDADGSYKFAAEDSFPVLSSGRVWMVANAALSVGAAVSWDPATSKVGANGAGTTENFGIIRKASAADGDLVIVELN